jgi:hypothetical protein
VCAFEGSEGVRTHEDTRLQLRVAASEIRAVRGRRGNHNTTHGKRDAWTRARVSKEVAVRARSPHTLGRKQHSAMER